MYSEGPPLSIERRSKKSKIGPSLQLNIQHGKSYYIYIEVMNQYAHDFNKRFSLRLLTDEMEKNEYRNYFNFRFSTFTKDNIKISEDLSNPLINEEQSIIKSQ